MVKIFTGPGSFSYRQGGVESEFLVYLKSTTSIAFTLSRWRQVTYFVILDLVGELVVGGNETISEFDV